jgi:iron(III) transport system ATP-binding protein
MLSMLAVSVSGLAKWFNTTDQLPVVNDINLSVERGEMLVLLGPSGCGKTTLLRCIVGLEEAQKGTIALGGKTVFDAGRGLNVPTHKRDIGMVFQNYSLWPHMNVRRNVEYPLRARGVAVRERIFRTDEVLKIVQCSHLAERLPVMLSGGQQQRIALARALAPRPSVMLLDEPLSNLDALLREELREQLRSIHRELGFTGIYVTHDQTEAFTLGTRVAVMNAGRIEQLGVAADVNSRPATEYVARFLGIRNTVMLAFEGQWASSAGPLQGDLGLFPRHGRALRLFARPEDVTFASPGSMPPQRALCLAEGQVTDTIPVGHETSYIVAAKNVIFHVRRPGTESVRAPGQRVALHVAHENLLLYDNGTLVAR